ncbi:MAG: (Fe-S)-binding protein [candidate division WOR-3 bacterium]
MNNLESINPEIRELILNAGGNEAYRCYECGMCMSLCPWFQIENVTFPCYRTPQNVRLGAVLASEDKEDIAKEITELFRCVACDNCKVFCPRHVDMGDIMRAIRRILAEYDSIPKELKDVKSKLYNVGNPLGEAAEKRNDWAKELNLPIYQPGMEYGYWACCLPAYDGRLKSIAIATAKILKLARVSFGLVPTSVFCCGETARNFGTEDLFLELAQRNIAEIKRAGIKKILLTSPHCYTTFKNEYPALGADFVPIPTVELFLKLIEEKRIVPQKPIIKKVFYHDPCTLGRQNGIYDEPRAVLASIPGVELVENPLFAREYSVCCGGGAGGLWQDWPKDERIAQVRIKQVAATGAEILATACPYCILMFEDSIKTLNLNIEVKDLSELLIESLF